MMPFKHTFPTLTRWVLTCLFLLTAPSAAEPSQNEVEPGWKGMVSTVATLDAGTGGLELGPDGVLYSSDFGARLGDAASAGTRVWRIHPSGEASVFADGFSGASGNVLDSDGNLYQANIRAAGVSKIDPSGKVTHDFAQGIPGPVGVVVADDEGLFVTSCALGSVHHVDREGTTTLFAQSPLMKCPNGIAKGEGDRSGELFVSNFYNGDVLRLGREGEVSVLATLPGGNNGHLVFHRDRLWVAARGAHQIYSVSMKGEITLVAGSGTPGQSDGPLGEASFSFPNDLVISPDGTTLFVNEVADPTSDGMTLSPTTIRRIDLHSATTSKASGSAPTSDAAGGDAGESGWSRFLELRAYQMHEPQRDRFLEYFEEHFLESQEVVNMRIWGQFRDLDNASQVIWLRGYRSLDERAAGLTAFYSSPVWQESGPDVLPMFAARATHVHFLEPVPGGAFAEDFRRAVLLSEATESLGVVVAEVYLVDDERRGATRDWLQSRRAPDLDSAGGRQLGLFASSHESNNFPLLPFIEDEDVMVLFVSFPSRDDYEQAGETPGGEPFETFVLEPGPRSRLFHRP